MASAAPPAFAVHNPEGRRPVVLICDHASNLIPRELGTLGLSDEQRGLHIAYDIGAAMVARKMADALDATLVTSGYSRLVIDCNRPPTSPTSIPVSSGGIDVPRNASLSDTERRARRELYFDPYHDAISAMLDARAGLREGRGPVLLSIHSFTPELLGSKRPWPVALLYGRDARLAHAFRDELARDASLLVGDNEPYRVTDASDHSIPVHGERRGSLHTAFEIRQDGIATEAGAAAWADRLVSAFHALDLAALDAVGTTPA